MKHLNMILLVGALLAVLHVLSDAHASSELHDMSSSPSEAIVITGEVLDIQENLYIIKTEKGQIARVRIYRGTVQDQSIVKGDKIEARVLPEWYALVLRQQH